MDDRWLYDLLLNNRLNSLMHVVVDVLTTNGGTCTLSVLDLADLTGVLKLSALSLESLSNVVVISVLDLTMLDSSHLVGVLFR